MTALSSGAKLASGESEQVMGKATINDVAKLAGVSIKTVSRVVNREANVRESTRKIVDDAVAELQYSPNQSARKLASRRSYQIALLYDDPSRYEVPSSGYVIKLQQGLLKACKQEKYDLLIHPCNYQSKGIADEVSDLIDHSRVDGIAVAPPLSNVPAIIEAIEAKGTPFVQISPGEQDKGRLTVVTNDREVCAEMTRYLASLGHERIAFITGDPTHEAVARRFLGYKDGLQQSGLPFRKTLVCNGNNSIRSGELCAEKLLPGKNRPTAIFAANDDMAAGVIRVAQRMSIDIPGQLSVAGFDNIPLSQQIYPALTTVNQPLASMAERAASLLIRNLKKDSRDVDPLLVPGNIEVRESTGPAPGGAELTEKTLPSVPRRARSGTRP